MTEKTTKGDGNPKTEWQKHRGLRSKDVCQTKKKERKKKHQ
jgi:hypothetical protein